MTLANGVHSLYTVIVFYKETNMTKVQIGDATLYLGDCAEILPTLGRFDAIVTDPPYGIGSIFKGGFCGGWKNQGRLSETRNAWDMETPSEDLINLIVECADYSIIWGGNYFNLPPSRCWLVWNKPERNFTLSDAELAWTSMDRITQTFDHARSFLGKTHPTEKPLKLMKWCISKLPPNVEEICDPFMGSGTTGVAAIQAGKKFVGIEREPAYFETAVKRIKEASDQGRLFAEPKRKPVAHPAMEFEHE